jgi:tetratricopeptide (TPR) repeat protein
VNPLAPIDARQFVQLVEPLLENQDLPGLMSLLKTRWQPEQIRALLRSRHIDAKKVALLALALVGPTCCIDDLALQLKDPDELVNQLAEHALWSVWFRASNFPQAIQRLGCGAQAMNDRQLPAALDHFNHAIKIDPDFAEAFNQRAIAHYLLEDYEKSIGDCRRAVKRMPCHFGAWAGLGHSFAHLNGLRQAIQCYEKALSVNPHLSCIRESIVELRRKLGSE